MHEILRHSPLQIDQPILRVRLTVRGAVQGVGFRPFIFRLADELGLTGWVRNSAAGVFVEAEGTEENLRSFVLRLEQEKPPAAFIQSLEFSYLDPIGYKTFEIHHSDDAGDKTALILPDLATCPDCLKEIIDPRNRRYLYPFTNCTNCGPRFTIIEALPYDRANTTMKGFTMCAECRTEYEDPSNRRFHAQPNACPRCGPQLELWDREGLPLAIQHDALLEAADAVIKGKILAVKGIGGFHLMVDGRNDEAVQRLRQRKHREEKPLALMYPSLEAIKADCEVSSFEQRLLLSTESPIVLLRRKRPAFAKQQISSAIAPGNPYLGVMLPYSPLHHLLMAELEIPVVATSGNLSDEPICTDEHEALQRLSGIADVFLVHNRPIVRHLDDSIVRVILGREMVLRRARGYAPLPVRLKMPAKKIIAVGAHLKNSVAIAVERQVFLSQHIGDLDSSQSCEAFRRVARDLPSLYDLEPELVACDQHPDYYSTQFARQLVASKESKNTHETSLVGVQHHFAHIVSCMAENELDGPVLGVAWDGTGYGTDGTIWGGEFLRATLHSFERIAHFRTFGLPGGEKAIKEPRRAALGQLYQVFGEQAFDMSELATIRAFSGKELQILRRMLNAGLNTPITSSAGRFFDAVASLIGLRQVNKFEGQGAMELEFALEGFRENEAYQFWQLDLETQVNGKLAPLRTNAHGSAATAGLTSPPIILDWEQVVRGIIDDLRRDTATGKIAARFHNALAEGIVSVANKVGEEQVVLSGGCFQNQYLLERTVRQLRQAGFRPYWHQRIPTNDGGIALGQAVAAAAGTQTK